MRNLDFEILKSNYWNLKIFLGLRNESGPKWVGAQMGQGPNELGPKWVRAQMSWGPNVLGPKWVGAQMCRGPNELGPKCVGAQMSQGPKWGLGPNVSQPCGRGDVSTPSFGSHFNPISTRGSRLCPPYTGVHTKFWKPQARLNLPYSYRPRAESALIWASRDQVQSE